MHESKEVRAAQVFGIAALAFAAALVITLLALHLRVWWGEHGFGVGASGQTYSEQQKLELLAKLAGDSTTSDEAKEKILKGLASPSPTPMSEQQKLDILQGLRKK